MMEIRTTFGGPCIYKQGFFPDGKKTGHIQDIGQSKEQLEKELLDSMKTGRDDVSSFVDTICGRNK